MNEMYEMYESSSMVFDLTMCFHWIHVTHNIGLRISSWWFQIFFICTPNPGKWSNLTISYFSTGLVQPPTRYIWRFSNYSWIFGAWWDSPIFFPLTTSLRVDPSRNHLMFHYSMQSKFFRLLIYGAYVYSIKTTSLLKLIYIYFYDICSIYSINVYI